MRKKCIVLPFVPFVPFFLLMFIVNNSFATIIGSKTLSGYSKNGGSYSLDWDWTMNNYIIGSGTATAPTKPNSNVGDNVGSSYTITSGDQFDNARTLLTNGVDDSMCLHFQGGYDPESQGPESMLWDTGHDPSLWRIDAITFKLENYFVYHDIYNGVDLGFYRELYVSMTVYGTSAPVPEPATMFLLGIGLVGLVGFRKKYKM